MFFQMLITFFLLNPIQSVGILKESFITLIAEHLYKSNDSEITHGFQLDIANILDYVNIKIQENLENDEIIFQFGVLVSQTEILKSVTIFSLDSQKLENDLFIDKENLEIQDKLYNFLNNYAINDLKSSEIITICINKQTLTIMVL